MIIDEKRINNILQESIAPSFKEIDKILEKSKQAKGLSLEETAILLNVEDKERINEIFNTAKEIKENKEVEKLGYIAKGEYGIAGRRFFLKGLYNRTHHIHIFQIGSHEIKRHLEFRDYMIAHPEDAKRYGELKKELAKSFRYDIEGYCDGKDSFIKGMEKKAEEWATKKQLT